MSLLAVTGVAGSVADIHLAEQALRSQGILTLPAYLLLTPEIDGGRGRQRIPVRSVLETIIRVAGLRKRGVSRQRVMAEGVTPQGIT